MKLHDHVAAYSSEPSDIWQDLESPLDTRLQSRTVDVANRLRFVCAHMQPEELLLLASRIAAVELKYTDGGLFHDRRRR
jgi:hypothetical protein